MSDSLAKACKTCACSFSVSVAGDGCPICQAVCVCGERVSKIGERCGYCHIKGGPVWRPIETAPESSSILAWNGICVMLVRRETFGWTCADFAAGRRLDYPPTHWMPLPDGPVAP